MIHPFRFAAVLAALVFLGTAALRLPRSTSPTGNTRTTPAPAAATAAVASRNDSASLAPASPASATPPPAASAPPHPAPEATASIAALPAPSPTEPASAAFHDWLQRRFNPAAPGQPALDTEGRELATRRRAELRSLIARDPRRALELALPDAVRSALPAAVADLVEERIARRGDLEVLCAYPEPGREGQTRAIRREAVFPDRRYTAFVYGRRIDAPTVRGASLLGIAIDGWMAVAESPVRRLPPETAVALAAQSPAARCAFDGDGAHPISDDGSEPVAVEAFGEVVLLCNEGHAARFEEQLVENEATPAPVASASNGASLASTASTPVLKSLLFIRVDFSDLPGEPLSTLRASSLAKELDQFYQESSYGRAGFKAIGAGSEVTPLFRMPRTAAYYGGNDDAATLRSDARAAARAAGYTLTSYDLDVTFLGSVAGFDWAGLGYVGAAGAWIRGTTSTGVTAHELGHNLGLSHANFWDTSGRSVTGTGASIEYGDKFDTMGAANAGAYHFNARFKRQLGWLKDGEFTVATTNGVYRIYAHDQNTLVAGSRGLQVFVNAKTNYWVEFRQKFTSKPALMNGVGLRWARREAGPSLLLDTTPGSAGEKDDSPIALGRTYSDLRTGIHMTPIAKGGSNPAWMDIVVNRGSFPTNQAPTLELESSTTVGLTSTEFRFRAQAADPDGDPLAYFWDFGDSTVSTNSPTATHRWANEGDYVVRCTVSDTRGGLALKSMAVRVELPGTYRLRGRVTADGEPVAGVLVSAGSGRTTLSDSDGSYVLTGLTRGSLSLTASTEGRQFDATGFTNPLNVTADRSGLDFTSVAVATRTPVTLLAAGSVWRYWDQGVIGGTAWRTAGFNDSNWNSGAAILGYGGDRETTVIGYGGDSAHKYITAWFRRTFVVDNPGRLANVRLGLLRDDGAVVYLNGQELLRDNLPAGTLTSQTLATNAVSGTAETTYFEFAIDPARFITGTNLFAVELHQSSQSSSDTAFDLRLTADLLLNTAPGVQLVRPNGTETFTAPARVALAATVGDLPGHTGAKVTRVEFLSGDQVVGTAPTPPYAAVWNSAPAGNHTLTAVVVLDDGARLAAEPVTVNVRDPALSPVLIPAGSIWRYLDTGVAPPPAWNLIAFEDSRWKAGPARLGYGEDGEFTVVGSGSDPTKHAITTWFRHSFDLSAASGIDSLLLRLQRDDGAVVYLNGQEVFRTGIRTGTITPTLVALSDIKDDAELVWIEHSLARDGLVEGENVVAVEVHQSSSTSTDLGFDLELRATRSSLPVEAPPNLVWQIADGSLRFRWPASYTNWRLETVATLQPEATWTPAAGTPVTNGDVREQSISPGSEAGAAFYRLARPVTP